MKQNDLKKAIEHNRNVLKQLGIVFIQAEKGTFNVSLSKRKVKRKNITSQEFEEKEVFFLQSSCGKLNFPVDLLSLTTSKTSSKLEVIQVECNPKGYITKVVGSFQ